MLNLTRKQVLKSVRFANKFYRIFNGKIYFYDDEMTISSDKEILIFQKEHFIKYLSDGERDYFVKLSDYMDKGIYCKIIFSAAINDLCELSSTSFGILDK